MDQRTVIEEIAPTVDEAIANGLANLGVAQNAVDIEIMDEGGKGIFNFGKRQARVRLTIKSFGDLENDEGFEGETIEDSNLRIDEDIILRVTKETVYELLEKMRISADVSVHYTDNNPMKPPSVFADIHGQDLSILIGRRAETLNALQYIAKIIISKELGRSIFLTVDVEGYRNRREQQLRNLAKRIARQAIATGRSQILEPMPPDERRLIHLELSNHPQVFTESVGDEPNRKVTISLKDTQ